MAERTGLERVNRISKLLIRQRWNPLHAPSIPGFATSKSALMRGTRRINLQQDATAGNDAHRRASQRATAISGQS